MEFKKGQMYKSKFSNLILKVLEPYSECGKDYFEGEIVHAIGSKSGFKTLEIGYIGKCWKKSNYELVEELKIGQKVEWTIGNVKSEGAVLECKGEFTEVMTHYIGGVRSNREVEVLTELLIKID